MPKIRLDLDALDVESFSTDRAGRTLAGTVRAHQDALDVPTLHTGYHGCYACPASVVRTCIPCGADTLLCADTDAAE